MVETQSILTELMNEEKWMDRGMDGQMDRWTEEICIPSSVFLNFPSSFEKSTDPTEGTIVDQLLVIICKWQKSFRMRSAAHDQVWRWDWAGPRGAILNRVKFEPPPGVPLFLHKEQSLPTLLMGTGLPLAVLFCF